MKELATIPPEVLGPQSFATKSQAKPMIKMINVLLKRRFRSPAKKGLTTGDVKIKQKKIQYW